MPPVWAQPWGLGPGPSTVNCHRLGQRIGFLSALQYGEDKLLCRDLSSVGRRFSVPPPPLLIKPLTPSSPVSPLKEVGGRV